MEMLFKPFGDAVAKQFAKMSSQQLYRVDIGPDDLWETYLGSFPEGSNPMFKSRTEHDCNCCKQFIRTVGAVVTVKNGVAASIWDIKVDNPNYQAVANALSALVKNRPLSKPFMHFERTVGTEKSFQQMDNGVHTWDHFFVTLPTKYVMPIADIPSWMGDKQSTYDMLLRGLQTITLDSVDTVLELIAQNSLYRGEEHVHTLSAFKDILTNKFATDPTDINIGKQAFVWDNVFSSSAAVTRIRNTSIGTLLVDISEGMDLEAAVKSFESKVAPTNYKRSSAVVTKGMVDKARADIERLGITSALQRRHAHLDDININNVLFADRSAAAVMGDVFDDLVTTAPARKMSKVEDIHIDQFIADVLPNVAQIEVLVDNDHTNRFVTLIAPDNASSTNIFKWDNNFSWSYTGDVTDSIKERVKKAGGSVEGDLCCRLAWDYTDDLDFHMEEPSGGTIYFGTRRRRSLNGGMLDVDANGADGMRDDPVENIFYKSRFDMAPGKYVLKVNNFNRRGDGIGFEVEIDLNGVTHNMNYAKAVRGREFITVCTFMVDKQHNIEFIPNLQTQSATKTVWGLSTQQFHKVSTVMMSPNYWDGSGVGNKHYFFMIDGCASEGNVRALYNEFLINELNPHRKVIEMIGGKLKTAADPQQLSGLGFSSTQRGELMCRVSGKFTRNIRIIF